MSAEQAMRWQHRRVQRPTSHWSPDRSDTTPHPGEVDGCPTCSPQESS